MLNFKETLINNNKMQHNKTFADYFKIRWADVFNHLSLYDALKHHFTSLKTIYFPTTKGFRRIISMKQLYQYMAIFFNFSATSSHLYPLQVKNCDSNSRLVVDKDDNGKVRLERVNVNMKITLLQTWMAAENPHYFKLGQSRWRLVPSWWSFILRIQFGRSLIFRIQIALEFPASNEWKITIQQNNGLGQIGRNPST